MTVDILVFNSNAEILGFYDTFVGGLLSGKHVRFEVLLRALHVVLGYGLILLWALHQVKKEKKIQTLCLSVSILFFFVRAFLLTHPPDEFFVNLRHAKHFAESWFFSFNRLQAIEAIADFLPFAVTGLLAKLGLPLPELAIFQSFLGGVFCILALYRIATRMFGTPQAGSWVAMLAPFYPPLVLNASTGFAATTFSAFVLWSIYFLFFTKNPKRGFVLLALLPIVRWEGFIFSLGLGSLFLVSNRTKQTRALLWFGLMFVPFLIHCVVRIVVYGHLLPIPVQYKSTGVRTDFLFDGIHRLVLEMNTGLGLPALVVIVGAYLLARWGKERSGASEKELFKSLAITLMSLLCVLPYFFSGGDWLPLYWVRYLLPFLLVVMFFCFAALAQVGSGRNRFVLVTVALLAMFQNDRIHDSFKAISQLLESNPNTERARIQHLSQVGVLLKTTTSPRDVVASTEVATVMYFADREGLDLLGIANHRLAKQPLRPVFYRHVLWKRESDPNLIKDLMPAIIWPFEGLYEKVLCPTSLTQISTSQLLEVEKDFSAGRFGGMKNVVEMGYQPIVVRGGDKFCTFYFVSKSKRSEHLAALSNQGFITANSLPIKL